MIAQRRPAQSFVEQPGEQQGAEGEGGRARGGEVEHRLVDEIELGSEIVDEDQQCEAGEPGGIGLPFEPGQLVRHPRGRHQVLHHVIETAAVHLPGIALDPLRQSRPALEAEIEVDEVERAADPADAGNDVQPPQDQAQPFGQHGFHGRQALLLAIFVARRSMQDDRRPLNVARAVPTK